MKPIKALLALSATASSSYSGPMPIEGYVHVFRAAQGTADDTTGDDDGNGSDATGAAGDDITIISGSSGVQEATGQQQQLSPEQPQPPSSSSVAVEAPNYTEEQCTSWIEGIFDADADSSSGLTEEEFYDFLTSIEYPPYVAEYFDQYKGSYDDLPWLFQVVHKTLACRCEDLGLGAGCCTGTDAELSFIGLRGADDDDTDMNGGFGPMMTEAQRDVAEEYRSDACNLMAVVFEKLIPGPGPTEPPSTAGPTGSPTTSSPTTSSPTTASPTTASPTTAPPTPSPTVGPTVREEETMPPAPPPEEEPEPAKITIDVVGSAIDYSDFDESDGYLNAEDVMTNGGSNSVLRHVQAGFGMLGGELATELETGVVTEQGKKRRERRRNLRGLQLATLGRLDPVQVTDIFCPAGLVYAPWGAYCLNFRFTVTPDNQDDAIVGAFAKMLDDAINEEGKLYDVVVELNPDTLVTGLGNPGKGIDYLAELEEPPYVAPFEATPEPEDDGLGIWAIVLIVLVVLVMPIAVLAMYARRKRRLEEEEERRARLLKIDADRALAAEADLGPAEPNSPGSEDVENPRPATPEGEPHDAMDAAREDDESSAPSVWSESSEDSDMISVDGEGEFVNNQSDASASRGGSVTAGSALAAMGTMGAAAALSPGRSGSRSGSDHDSRSDEGSLSGMKAEIRYLANVTNSPKSADELLTIYAGKEHSLLAHMRQLRDMTSTTAAADAGAGGSRDAAVPVVAPAADAGAGGSRDAAAPVLAPAALAAAAAGTAAVVAAAATTKRKADGGAVDDKAEIRVEIRSLVKEVNTPRTADELMAAYTGKEEVLLSHLRKMKERQAENDASRGAVAPAAAPAAPSTYVSTKQTENASSANATGGNLRQSQLEVRSLVNELFSMWSVNGFSGEAGDETINPKTAEELMVSYEGREDVLLSQLRKMKEKKSFDVTTPQQKDAGQATGTDEELLPRAETLQNKNETAARTSVAAAASPSSDDKANASSGKNAGFKYFQANPILQKYPVSSPPDGNTTKRLSHIDEELLFKISSRALATGAGPPEGKAKPSSEFENELHSKMKVMQEAPESPASDLVVDEEKSTPMSSPLIDSELDHLMDTMNSDQMEGIRTDTAPPPLEDELLDSLKMFKKKKAGKEAKAAAAYAEIRAEVVSLVNETQPGTNADELLAQYTGKEDDLIANLKQLKARKHLKATKREIV